jgi:hypothetical protein
MGWTPFAPPSPVDVLKEWARVRPVVNGVNDVDLECLSQLTLIITTVRDTVSDWHSQLACCKVL